MLGRKSKKTQETVADTTPENTQETKPETTPETPQATDPEKPSNTPEEETKMPEEPTNVTEPVEETTALATVPKTGVAIIDALLQGPEVFTKKYGNSLAQLAEENVSEDTLFDRIETLDEDAQEKLANMIKRMNPEKKGVISDNARPIYTDLRLFQGVGNDENRPDTAIPGQFYLTTKENVGKEFIGTVICVWEGRSMWGDREDGGNKTPICQSLDRNVGNYYGDCDTCPQRPWKDGKKPEHCHNEVSAFMLSKDLKDIVRIRFQRTSEPAGNRLLQYMKRSQNPWSRWYKITAEAVTSKNDSSYRYYVMKVNVAEGEDGTPAKVDKGIQGVCDAFCSITLQSFLYPAIQNVYRQAAQVKEEFGDGSAKVDSGVKDSDYSTMEEPSGTDI